MTASEGETIGEILLRKRTSRAIGFETLVSTAVAGVVLATLPTGIRGSVVFISAIFLLLIVIIRWLGVNGRFSEEEVVLSRTVKIQELLLVVGVFHLINFMVTNVTTAVHSPLNQPFITSIATIFVALTGIVGIEFIQRSYRVWWGTVFYVQALASQEQREEAESPVFSQLHTAFYNVWARVAYFLLRDSIPEGDEPELEDLREFVKMVDEHLEREDESNSGIRRVFILSAVTVIPTFLVIAYVLSYVLGPFFEVFAVLIAVWCLQHIINFFYLTNGMVTVDNWLKSGSEALLYRLAFTGAVYLIFFGNLTPLSI